MATKTMRANVDMNKNELMNVKGHNVNGTPNDVVESQFWYDTTSQTFKFRNATATKNFGVEYTDGNGININNDVISIDTTVVATQTDLEGKQDTLTFSTGLTDTSGTITVTDYNKLVKNTATGSNSIGIGGAMGSTATGSGAVAIGDGTLVSKDGSIAIGSLAWVSEKDAIQLGAGTNSTAHTLQVGFRLQDNQDPSEYTLLDGTTGLIPDARISSNIARTSAIPTTVAELTDSSNYALKSDLTEVFNPSGTVASASDLPTLSSSVVGNIYRVTTAFNTTSDFVEGSGKEIQVGNDIVVVNTGTDANPTYKFNVWGDFIDLSGYVETSDLATVATSGDYDDLTNKPTIPSDTGDLTNGAGFITGIDSSDVTTALGYTPCKKLTANNTSMTASSGGELTMEVANTLATADIGVHVYEISTGLDITSSVNITVTSSTITVKMNGSGTVAADTFRVVAIG